MKVTCPICGLTEDLPDGTRGMATCECGAKFRVGSPTNEDQIELSDEVRRAPTSQSTLRSQPGMPKSEVPSSSPSVGGGIEGPPKLDEGTSTKRPIRAVRQKVDKPIKVKPLVPCPACGQPMTKGEPCASCAVIAGNLRRIAAEKERADEAERNRWKLEDTKDAAGCIGNGCLWLVAIGSLLVMVGPWLLAVFPLVALVAICAFVVAIIFALFFKR